MSSGASAVQKAGSSRNAKSAEKIFDFEQSATHQKPFAFSEPQEVERRAGRRLRCVSDEVNLSDSGGLAPHAGSIDAILAVRTLGCRFVYHRRQCRGDHAARPA